MRIIRKLLLGTIVIGLVLVSAVVVKAVLTDPPPPPADVDTTVQELTIDLGDFAPSSDMDFEGASD